MPIITGDKPVNLSPHRLHDGTQYPRGPWARRGTQIGQNLFLAETAGGQTSRNWLPALLLQCDPNDPDCYLEGWQQLGWVRKLYGGNKGWLEAHVTLPEPHGRATASFREVDDAVHFMRVIATAYYGAEAP